MKKIFYLCLFLSTGILPQSWIWQNPNPQGKDLYGITSTDSMSFYCTGDAGAFLFTIDGGNNWINRDLNLNINFRSAAVNGNYILLAGENGNIYYSNNKGNSFVKSNSSTQFDINKILFDGNTAFSVGNNGTLLTSTDYVNWTSINAGTDKVIGDIYFVNNTIGFICGEGFISKTLDAGKTWNNIYEDNNLQLTKIFFTDENSGYAAGFNGTLLKTEDAGGHWSNLNLPDNKNVLSIYFINKNKGYILFSDYKIFSTKDGGNNWVEVNSLNFPITSLCYVQNNSFILTCLNGAIVKSNNLFESYSTLSSGYAFNLYNCYFFNKEKGFVIGSKGLILNTTDGGKNWGKIESGRTENLYGITFLNDERGFICGSHGLFMNTSDGGHSWVADTNFEYITIENLRSMLIDSVSHIFGGSGEVLASTDTFKTFTRINSKLGADLYAAIKFPGTVNNGLAVGDNGRGSYFFYDTLMNYSPYYILDNGSVNFRDLIYFNDLILLVGSNGAVVKLKNSASISSILDVNYLNSLSYLNDNLIYTAGTFGSLFKTTDMAENWTKVNTYVTNILNKVFFFDETTGWLLGDNGLLLKFNPNGNDVSYVKNDKQFSIQNFDLSQNYPNPFNSATIIKYRVISSGSKVRLKIYDILGKEVAELKNETQNAGEYSVRFDSEKYRLSSGVYFYSLSVNNKNEIKKMVILK